MRCPTSILAAIALGTFLARWPLPGVAQGTARITFRFLEIINNFHMEDVWMDK
jgi:hypothetical protein